MVRMDTILFDAAVPQHLRSAIRHRRFVMKIYNSVSDIRSSIIASKIVHFYGVPDEQRWRIADVRKPPRFTGNKYCDYNSRVESRRSREAAVRSTVLDHEITQWLQGWRNGDHTALEKLTPLVYQELHRLAKAYMRGERAGHALQTTALVNEAYLRLIGGAAMEWQNRAHFYAVAAKLMRHIL